MNLIRLEGDPVVLWCTGCGREGIGGTKPYESAASGEQRVPQDWYIKEDHLDHETYCGECAAKLVQSDPTRSVTQYYADTAGTSVLVQEPEKE